MLSRTLLMLGCAGLLVAPAAATAKDGGVSICHRTGAPSPAGLFPGHILKVSGRALTSHVGHGDVAIPDTLLPKFGSSRICRTNAAGALFDSAGKPVQTTSTGGGWGGGGGDPDGAG